MNWTLVLLLLNVVLSVSAAAALFYGLINLWHALGRRRAEARLQQAWEKRLRLVEWRKRLLEENGPPSSRATGTTEGAKNG